MRDDLHEWRTCAIVVTESFSPCMDELACVILDMHMMYTKNPELALDQGPNLATISYRLIELSNLVSHREVRIEVALAIEYTRLLYGRSECVRCSDGEINDSGRDSRQHPRESHTYRTHMDIGFTRELECVLTTAEHLGV